MIGDEQTGQPVDSKYDSLCESIIGDKQANEKMREQTSKRTPIIDSLCKSMIGDKQTN